MCWGAIMRTTVTLDEEMVRELMEYCNAKSKTAAVASAIKDQIRRAKLKQLASLLGTVEVDENSLQESNEADMRRAQWLEETGR